MVGVRGKQRNKRRGKISNTAYGKIRKRAHQKKHKIVIGNELVRESWDKKKTIKENFSDLGLISDPNSEYRKTHHKKAPDMEVEVGDIADYELVRKLEKQAQQAAPPALRHYSPAESELWEGLVAEHGIDFKAMARDKRNTHQHTPKFIQRKIEQYLQFKDADFKTKMGCVG